jgi:hypothetical protein
MHVKATKGGPKGMDIPLGKGHQSINSQEKINKDSRKEIKNKLGGDRLHNSLNCQQHGEKNKLNYVPYLSKSLTTCGHVHLSRFSREK